MHSRVQTRPTPLEAHRAGFICEHLRLYCHWKEHGVLLRPSNQRDSNPGFLLQSDARDQGRMDPEYPCVYSADFQLAYDVNSALCVRKVPQARDLRSQ